MVEAVFWLLDLSRWNCGGGCVIYLQIVFQGPVQSSILAFFGQDRDRTGLQKFPFWEKTEPDWEKPDYIGPVLNICQL